MKSFLGLNIEVAGRRSIFRLGVGVGVMGKREGGRAGARGRELLGGSVVVSCTLNGLCMS